MKGLSIKGSARGEKKVVKIEAADVSLLVCLRQTAWSLEYIGIVFWMHFHFGRNGVDFIAGIRA